MKWTSTWLIGLLFFIPLVTDASVSVSVNGTSYTIPQTNEKGWGNNVTTWIQAISANTLQPSGGTFTLGADVDFGASFGLKVSYIKSRATNISSAGVLRLGNAEMLGWRNAANSANLTLGVNASNWLQFNSIDLADISTAQTLTNKSIDAATNTLTNIANSSIATSAAIARSKLAALTASRAMVTDVSGNDSASSVTSTELGYVSGVTSAIQTQFAGKTDKSTLTTKGDLYVATASATIARQGIGSDGQFLQADSSQTNGIKWASAVNNLTVSSKTGAYTLTTSDDSILANTSGGAFTLTLPTAVGNTGKIFRIKLATAGNILTIATTSSQTIDVAGATTLKMATLNDFVTLMSDGSNWKIVDESINGSVSIQGLTSNASVTLAASGTARTITELTGNAVDPLGQFSSGVFTATRGGRYLFSCSFAPYFSNVSASNFSDILLVPSSGFGIVGRAIPQQISNGLASNTISKVFNLAAGATVTVKVSASYGAGTATLYGTDPEFSSLSIVRVGN